MVENLDQNQILLTSLCKRCKFTILKVNGQKTHLAKCEEYFEWFFFLGLTGQSKIHDRTTIKKRMKRKGCQITAPS